MKNTKKRGFTIVELVIVIAVIAILASVLIPTFTNVVNAAKKSNALQQARNAYTDYLADYVTKNPGSLPTEATCIKVTIGKDANAKDYYFKVENGQFTGEVCATPTDATGHKCYVVENGKFKVGADGNATLADHKK